MLLHTFTCCLTLQVVEAYNTDPKVHGILVQLPLPPHIDERRILDAISIDKDIDGAAMRVVRI